MKKLIDKNELFIITESLYGNSGLLLDWCNELTQQNDPKLWDHHDVDLISFKFKKLNKLFILTNKYKNNSELICARKYCLECLEFAKKIINKWNKYN